MRNVNKIGGSVNSYNKTVSPYMEQQNNIYYSSKPIQDTFSSKQKKSNHTFLEKFTGLFKKCEKQSAIHNDKNNEAPSYYVILGNKKIDFNILTPYEKQLIYKYQNPSLNYDNLLTDFYERYRGKGVYVNANNYVGDLELLQKFIDGDNNKSLTNSSVILSNQKGWVYRAYGDFIDKEELGDRISLNAKGSASLISELDRFMSSGEYVVGGKTYRVNNITPFYYKTPNNIYDWGSRVDPITFYFKGKVNDETLYALSNITLKYKRGNIQSPINDIANWLAKDRNIQKEDVDNLVDIIRNIYGYEDLANAIENKAATSNGILSAGQFYAALLALNSLVDYNNLVKKYN